MQALAALQTLMAAAPSSSIDAAGAAPQAGDMARIAAELDAVAAGTAQATQKILAAAEEIDQLANNLSAALKGRLERELAQDIADSALRIFEACNFQDLVGQRVAKVMKTLKVDEALAAPATADAPDLHGPRLAGDQGHLSQREIDSMFED
jgi:chemotaxis protein CheZ